MKTFRTDVSITPCGHPISHAQGILTLGSCFAQAIGERLRRFKFKTDVSPFGVIYNPVSIHKALRYAAHQEPPPAHTWLRQQDIFLNYDFHSSIFAADKQGLSEKINSIIGSTHYFLKDASWILITYGTAWVYSLRETGEVVANCHKMPSAAFTKSMLTEEQIIDSFAEAYRAIRALNPRIRFILTLSPVRHLKDTLALNSAGKAMVRVACHHLAERFSDVTYFPAYEIMMDDLRDYRFYRSDMLHPTEEAEDYIWEKFSEHYLDAASRSFIREWQTVLSALKHKPFHPSSPAHQQFLKETLKKAEALGAHADVADEIKLLASRIREGQERHGTNF